MEKEIQVYSRQETKEIKSESNDKGFLGNVVFMMNDLVVS